MAIKKPDKNLKISAATHALLKKTAKANDQKINSLADSILRAYLKEEKA